MTYPACPATLHRLLTFQDLNTKMTYSIDLLSDASKRAEEIFFQAGNNSSRAARNRCFHAICAFNEVDLDAPASERVAAWNK